MPAQYLTSLLPLDRTLGLRYSSWVGENKAKHDEPYGLSRSCRPRIAAPRPKTRTHAHHGAAARRLFQRCAERHSCFRRAARRRGAAWPFVRARRAAIVGADGPAAAPAGGGHGARRARRARRRAVAAASRR